MSVTIKCLSSNPLTLSFQVFAQLWLGFSVGPQTGLGVELVRHGGGSDHSFQAASAALGHILLRVEEHHIDFRHVQHPQRHGRAQTHWDGQCGRLYVHLQNKITAYLNDKSLKTKPLLHGILGCNWSITAFCGQNISYNETVYLSVAPGNQYPAVC